MKATFRGIASEGKKGKSGTRYTFFDIGTGGTVDVTSPAELSPEAVGVVADWTIEGFTIKDGQYGKYFTADNIAVKKVA